MAILGPVLTRCAAAIVVLATPIVLVLHRLNVDQAVYIGTTQLGETDLKVDSGETRERQIEDYKLMQDISNHLKDYWLYFRAVVNQNNLQDQLENVDDGYIATNSMVQKFIDRSETERGKEIRKITDFVRNEIYKRQHPESCDEAKLAVADMTIRSCGFGCTLHSVVKYLITAFMANRTLVLKSAGWGYAKEGWEFAFLPLGNCRYEGKMKGLPILKGRNAHERVVQIPQRKEQWLPWTVPKELAPTLERLHSHPYAWWISQFTSYALRLQQWMEEELQKRAEDIGFHGDVAGIQVRWGDKLNKEADKHEVEEYMIFVEKWNRQLENRGIFVNRTVYLASEDKEVWAQMRQKYPNYILVGVGPSKWKQKPGKRYKHDGLVSVVTDIYFLSRCSYLVCTLSSSVCRTAYEMMTNRWGDASARFQSVDALYRLKAADYQPWVATMAHEATGPGEISLEKGDAVKVTLDPHLPFNDGFFRGINQRTGEEGKFPVYKVQEVISTYEKQAFMGTWQDQSI